MQRKETKVPQALMRLALGLALLGLAGCYPPSALEMDYGNAVRSNLAQQVVNPRAGYNPKPAVGLSPQAGANEMERYDKAFKEEPKQMGKQLTTNVKYKANNEPRSPHHQEDRGGLKIGTRGERHGLGGRAKTGYNHGGSALRRPP